MRNAVFFTAGSMCSSFGPQFVDASNTRVAWSERTTWYDTINHFHGLAEGAGAHLILDNASPGDGMIAINIPGPALDPWVDHIELADTVSCQYCMPDRMRVPIYICRGLKLPMAEFWPKVKCRTCAVPPFAQLFYPRVAKAPGTRHNLPTSMFSVEESACGAFVVVIGLLATACRPARLASAPVCGLASPKRVRSDVAVVRPQYDRHIGGFIEKFDGTDVGRYLRGWGIRPKLPEIGVDPGVHTFEVGYYDFRRRAFSPGTDTVRFAAEAGHLYRLRFEPLSFVSKVGALISGRTTSWRAHVDDAGCVGEPVQLLAPAAKPTPARHPRRRAPSRHPRSQ
jgi:hypothetical protein